MRTIRFLSPCAALAALVLAGCAVGGHHNPIDPVSNAKQLDYTDVTARRPDFKELFLRDGVVTRPAQFDAIQVGLQQPQVRQLLGEPVQQKTGPRGVEWDYNFKFRLPQSQNYLVCQYKVVFDDRQVVSEAAWRRRQCLQLTQS